MTCISAKTTYRSEKDARRNAKINGRWHLYPYRCELCRLWHLKSGDHGQRTKRIEGRRA
mgnify:CR=1 FL=1